MKIEVILFHCVSFLFIQLSWLFSFIISDCQLCTQVTLFYTTDFRSVVSDSLRRHELYVACQVPLSMGFSRQEYWSGLPFPSLGDLPNPETEPRSPALQADY